MLPGRREYFRFARNAVTHHSWCAVRPDAISEPLRHRLITAPSLQALTPRLHDMVEFGLSVPASANLEAADLIEHLGFSVLHEYLFESSTNRHEDALPTALHLARAYVDTHLAQPLDLRTIAQAAYVTPPYLIRLFRQHLGTTPSRYLWQVRLSRGVELLRETGLSIAEIAQRTGFKNPFHFSRMVKQHYGAPPKQLRKHAWNTAQPMP